MLCDKDDNYMFSMHISRNENYSCWPAEVTRMRRTLFELIVIVIARMTRNDTPTEHEWSIGPRSAVDSAQWDWA